MPHRRPSTPEGARPATWRGLPLAVLALLPVALAAGPFPAAAQVPCIDARFEPEAPVQGRLFRVIVNAERAEQLVELSGWFAGEPLHFHPVGAGEFVALAASPIDSAGLMPMPLVARWNDDAVDSLPLLVSVRAGRYRMEALSVAPRFGQPPDSALQARMRNEAARAHAVSERSHDTPRLWRAPVAPPRASRVTSGFGDGRTFNGQVTSRHMGTDFAGAVGAPVRAAARGVVALVDHFHLGGKVIYIDHGDGLVTAYLHLSEQLAAVGDTVDAGQVLGRVGVTGRVTGPHLHWIVRYGRITVDPTSLLALEDSAAEAVEP